MKSQGLGSALFCITPIDICELVAGRVSLRAKGVVRFGRRSNWRIPNRWPGGRANTGRWYLCGGLT